MKMTWGFMCAVLLHFALLPPAYAADTIPQTVQKAKKQGIVIQVSDDNPATWGQALNVAENTIEMLGKDNVEVEIVAFGKGLGILLFDSPVGTRIGDQQKAGIQFRACGVTMRRTKVTEKDLYPGIPVVPAGVVEIMKKTKEGWFHVRP